MSEQPSPTRLSAETSNPADTDDIAARLAAVRAGIDEAATAAGRSPSDIRLLPVTKTVSEDRLRAAHAAGIHEMAENRVQEVTRKAAALADLGIDWVVIGHLQTNKARDVAALASEFQALNSLRLADALERRLAAVERHLSVYVQVNSSGEESKTGLPPQEVLPTLEALASYEHLRIQGLMTIAAHTDNQDRIRECFVLTRELRDAALREGTAGPGLLSMGMSGDYALAIAEGATTVRVGSAIFGARPPAGRRTMAARPATAAPRASKSPRVTPHTRRRDARSLAPYAPSSSDKSYLRFLPLPLRRSKKPSSSAGAKPSSPRRAASSRRSSS